MAKNFVLILIFSSTLQAATYYASPNGRGDGRSASNPFQIKEFWSVAKPGDVLLLLDGRYTGDNSMITPPEGLRGSAGNPVTLKALNDGNVEIDGESMRKPVYLRYNDYFILEGFNAHSGDYCVVEITRSSNNIVRRVCAWDAHPNQNAMVFASHYGSDNLFEDCAGWGSGRKIFALFGDTRTTLRRCFFRWTTHTLSGGSWRVGMTLTYYSTETLIENCIGTWDQVPGSSVSGEDWAVFGVDRSANAGTHRMLGCLGYLLSTQGRRPYLIFGIPESSYDGGNFDYIVKDCIAYTDINDQNVMGFGSQTSYTASYLTAIGGNQTVAWSGQREPIKYCIIQDGDGVNYGELFDYIMFWNNTSNFGGSAPAHYKIANPALTSNSGNILQVGLNEGNRPKVNGRSVGAQLQYRYVDGQLTNEPLWPWPMNERIKGAMVQSGYDKKGGLDGKGGTDLTKIVFELGGGTLPPDFGGQPTFTAHIIADITSGLLPLTVSFQGSASNGTLPYSFSWDFRDGNNSTAQNPTHTFESSGTYMVVLTVTDKENNLATDSITIIVDDPEPTSHSSINALKTIIPITIDGILSNDAWNQAEYVTFSNPIRSDNQVKVYTLWDNDFLYLAYEVTDSNLEAQNQSYWEDDGAEVYLDTKNDKTSSMNSDDYHFIINIKDQTQPTGINVRTTTKGGGYITEISIPWTLMSTIPLPGKTMGLLLANNDRDQGKSVQFDWLNLIETGSYARPNLWGDIVLSGEQARSVDNQPPSSPTGLKVVSTP